MKDLIIIGAGPGAIQLAVRLEERMKMEDKAIDYIIIEENYVPGSNFIKYPVHKKLISNNKLYTGKPAETEYSERFDWNSIITKEKKILARNYSSDFYPDSNIILDMLGDIQDTYHFPIHYLEKCLSIQKNEDIFQVKTDKDCYESKNVIVATGYKPCVAAIPGVEQTTPYEKMKHKTYYRDKSVFIIGKGNSALECAKDIINEANMILLGSPESVKFAYQSHYVGNARMVNCVPIENYQLKSLSAFLDCNIDKIQMTKEGKYIVQVAYTHANGEKEDIMADEVICATGFEPNLPEINPQIGKLHQVFPEIDGQFHAKGIEGLYFAGAITHGLDYRQYSSSGFIHGFRYNSINLADILFEKVTGVDNKIKIENEDIAIYLFSILNNNAGIYLQPGFIGVHLVYENGELHNMGYSTVKYFEEMEECSGTHLLLTLEYGDINHFNNVLSIERKPGVPTESVHIHPVIRKMAMKYSDKYVLEENLFNVYSNSNINVTIMEQIVKDFIHEK